MGITSSKPKQMKDIIELAFFNAFLALSTWYASTVGANLVYRFALLKESTQDVLYAVSAGIMLSRCVFRYIELALVGASSWGTYNWIPLVGGITLTFAIYTYFDDIFEKKLQRKFEEFVEDQKIVKEYSYWGFSYYYTQEKQSVSENSAQKSSKKNISDSNPKPNRS